MISKFFYESTIILHQQLTLHFLTPSNESTSKAEERPTIFHQKKNTKTQKSHLNLFAIKLYKLYARRDE